MLGTVRGLIVSGPGAVRPGDIWPKGVDGQWVKLDLRARDGEIWKMLRMEGLAEDGGIQEAFSPYCGRGWGLLERVDSTLRPVGFPGQGTLQIPLSLDPRPIGLEHMLLGY